MTHILKEASATACNSRKGDLDVDTDIMIPRFDIRKIKMLTYFSVSTYL